MSFYINLGYAFKIPERVEPSGSILSASTMAIHTIQRRKFREKYLANRLFDPQLYLAPLDSAVAPDHCTKLASYPWFGINTSQYQSAQQNQREWMSSTSSNIKELWTGCAPSATESVQIYAREAIELQQQIGCCGIILPSPLTIEPSTNYQQELLWLDSGIDYYRSLQYSDIPLYATIALSDLCIRFLEPQDNPLLELILDVVSARRVDGVYIVVEQASERDDERHIANSRVLRSILHLIHSFSKDAELDVGVNFVGAFGLACKAAGAKWWSSNWYKSLYRLRIADKASGGRTFPSFWSHVAASDIHLDTHFDAILGSRQFHLIKDITNASNGLIEAAQKGQSSKNVPAWTYRQSNVAATIEHYLSSIISKDAELEYLDTEVSKLDYTEKWLMNASLNCDKIDSILCNSSITKTKHVRAWHEAFCSYRRDHKV
jgi:hypothetical protein